jgi:uncharacterized membrane protein YjjB (DUF3815 family)
MVLFIPWLVFVCLVRVTGRSWPWSVLWGTVLYAIGWGLVILYYEVT